MRDHPASVPHAPDPLLRRMTGLGLDPAAVARSEPDVFDDLRHRCENCRSLGPCLRDLKTDPAGSMRYCPNHGLLNFLTDMWWLRTLP